MWARLDFSKRSRIPKENFRSHDRYGFHNVSLLAAITSVSISNFHAQAVTQRCQQQAMKEELDAPETNDNWDVVHCPDGTKPIGCKQVYSVKLKLVVLQIAIELAYLPWVRETFAPVAQMTNVSIMST